MKAFQALLRAAENGGQGVVVGGGEGIWDAEMGNGGGSALSAAGRSGRSGANLAAGDPWCLDAHGEERRCSEIEKRIKMLSRLGHMKSAPLATFDS